MHSLTKVIVLKLSLNKSHKIVQPSSSPSVPPASQQGRKKEERKEEKKKEEKKIRAEKKSNGYIHPLVLLGLYCAMPFFHQYYFPRESTLHTLRKRIYFLCKHYCVKVKNKTKQNKNTQANPYINKTAEKC